MEKKKKYYCVAVGRKTGIFHSWPEAEAQVKGYAGAKFKGFPTRKEAEEWLHNPSYTKGSGTRKKRGHVEKNPVHPDGTVVVYTDGGAINNPGPGGYGAVIMDNDQRKELSGGFRLTTNNRMELTACIVALEYLGNEKREIILYSDSQYVVNGIRRGWAVGWRKRGWKKADGNPAINQDLWARLLDCIGGLKITFRWVRGHSGHPINERCDQLAVTSAKSENLPIDEGYRVDG